MRQDQLEEKLGKHRDFWTMKEVEHLLVGVNRCPAKFEDFKWNVPAEAEISPGHLDVEYFLPQYEENFLRHGLWGGDLLWTAVPLPNMPWMEAIMGCDVHFSNSGKSIWAKAVLEGWAQLDELSDYRNSPWLKKAIELTVGLVELSAGRFPVVMCLQRGPLDVAVALRGLEKLALDVYDHPRQVKRLLSLCAEANTYVSRCLAEKIPAFHGGYANYYGLWAPGWPYLHQEDAMATFSPRLYRTMVRPLDVKIMGQFDHAICKFHSSALHWLEDGVSIDEAIGIQVTVDPTGPGLEELCAIFAGLQRRKPLAINCTSKATADFLASRLPPKGGCLFYWV